MKKITMATVKSFIRMNPDFLFINVKEQEFRKNFNRFLNLKI